MRPYELGQAPYEELMKAVASLGLKTAKEKHPLKDWVEVEVRNGRTPVGLLRFYSNAYSASLLLLAPEPGATGILAGSGHIDSQRKADAALEDIETVLRAHLVVKKKLRFEDFPCDRALIRWASDVIETCETNARFTPRSGKSRRALGDLRSLVANYDRAAALKLQRALAGQPKLGEDRSLTYMASAASNMADTPFVRAVLALNHGSFGAHLIHAGFEPPERMPVPDAENPFTTMR